MGPTRSSTDFNSTVRSIPKECRAHQHRGGSLKSTTYYMLLLKLWKLLLFRTRGSYLCSVLTKSKILCKRGWKLIFWKCHITWIRYGLPSLNKLQLFRKICLLIFSRKEECISETHATNYVRIRGATDGGLISPWDIARVLWDTRINVMDEFKINASFQQVYLQVQCTVEFQVQLRLRSELHVCSGVIIS
jgi:hypothetical protein